MARRESDGVDGIYRQQKKQSADPVTVSTDEAKKLIRKAFNTIGRALDLDHQLGSLEAVLSKIVIDAGGQTEWMPSVPDDADYRSQHAAVGLTELGILRRNMEQEDIKGVSLRALRFGQIAAEVNAMRFEPLVKTGRRTLQNAAKTNRKKQGKKQQRLEALRAELEKGGKRTAAVSCIAKRFGVLERTVWKDINNL